jgi:hypothetical protein
MVLVLAFDEYLMQIMDWYQFHEKHTDLSCTGRVHIQTKRRGGRPGIQKLIMKIIDDNVGKSISIASIWTYPKLVFLNYLCLNLFTT